MPVYKYSAKDLKGRRFSGFKEARNQDQLRDILKSERLILISSSLKKESAGLFSGSKIRENQVINFTREMAVMINSGLTILGALNVLSQTHSRGELHKFIEKVKKNISEGHTLYSSYQSHIRTFGATYVNLIRAGEVSGNLGGTMEELATLLEKNQEIKKKIQGAMVYPITVLAITLIISGGLIVFVLPSFTEMFVSTGAKLPFITQLLLDISSFIRVNWHMLLAALAVLGVILKFILRTEKGQEIKNRIKYGIPVFGRLSKDGVILRFTRTMSTLLESGIPVLKSLEIAAKSVGDPYFEKKIKEVQEDVTSGLRISKSLERTKFFPVATISLVSVGEESGELVSMFRKISDYNEKHLNFVIKDAIALMEPITVVLLGAIVGTIVVAMYLPMFDMINLSGR